MSDGSDPLDQDDIESLLAQAASGAAPKPAEKAKDPSAGSDDDLPMGQDEIEALLSGGAPASAPTATAAPPIESTSNTDDGTITPSDVELLLNRAEEAIASIDQPLGSLPPGVQPFHLEDFGGTPANDQSATLELVRDVQLDLKIELGRTRMSLENVLRLQGDAVITLDKLAGDPVDVYANGRIIARGEVLVLNDNFCVRITELVVGDSAVA